MSILIKNVLLNDKKKDVYVEGNIIKEIKDNISLEAEYKIDGNKKAILPSFFNSHTHAAMSLLKGYADDMKLHEWLQQKIWPAEKKFKEKEVYVGTKLAVLEMIKTGTTFFNDMYWYFEEASRAAEEMSVRAVIGQAFIDGMKLKKMPKNTELIKYAYAPHAIYTVSEENLRKIKELADKENRFYHIHISETKKETEDSLSRFGKRPIEYLNEIEVLGENVTGAHAIWLSEKETKILAEKNVSVVYNPASNQKLGSGVFPYPKLKKAGAKILLGTDSNASNNNLDMFEEMKIGALLQKVNNTPTTLPAQEIHEIATIKAAETFKINAGKIEEGKLADFILVDLKNINLFPNYNLISNIVYSAHGDCVTHTVCNGKILMADRKVKGEEKIIEEAEKTIRESIS